MDTAITPTLEQRMERCHQRLAALRVLVEQLRWDRAVYDQLYDADVRRYRSEILHP